MGSPIRISQHKNVILTRTSPTEKAVSITGDIPLVLEEEVTLNLESNFEPVYEGFDSTLLNAIGGISRDIFGFGFSGKTQGMGYQVWKSTSPISLNLPFTFHLGMAGKFDARKEVYEPMIALMKLPLPTIGIGGDLVPPGPSALAAFTGKSVGDPTLTKNYLSLSIAKILSISSIIVKRAEPTWANEFDSNGYPIWGKIALEIESVLTATVNLLDFVNTPAPDFGSQGNEQKPEPKITTIVDNDWQIGAM